MIEKIILDYLSAALDVPVCMEIPQELPEKFVAVEKLGSGRSNRLYTATFAFQSNAPSLYEAACLNELVKTAMDAAIQLKEIARARLNSDYNFTDAEKKQYRYQAVYEITHY